MGTLVLTGATSGSSTLTPVDAVTAVITLPSATATLATLGANTFTGAMTATAFIPNSATIPSNGLYLPAANTLACSVNSVKGMALGTTGLVVGSTATNSSIQVGDQTNSGASLWLSGQSVASGHINWVINQGDFGNGMLCIAQSNSAGGGIGSTATARMKFTSGYTSLTQSGTTQWYCDLDTMYVYVGVNPTATGATAGRIFSSSAGASSATLYIGNASINVTSDARLKTNIRDTERDAVGIINQLRVVDHGWNDPSDQCVNNRDSRGEWMGVVAQEAISVVPWLVNKPLVDEEADGTKNYWNMDLAYGFALTSKAIQQLDSRLAALRAEFDAYKDAHP